jgi:hypothetical protein
VDSCGFGVAPDSVQQDGLPDTAQANQHHALRVPADSGTLERDAHLLEERIATGKLDRW